jgi:hypothetical protein
MAIWTFKDFVSPAGINQISKWREDLSPAAKVKFDDQLVMLAKIENWQMPEYRPLRGKPFKGLSEIRFNVEKRKYRVIGLSRPIPKEYLLLIGCFHKESYEPHNALETAIRRKTEIETGIGRLEDHAPKS